MLAYRFILIWPTADYPLSRRNLIRLISWSDQWRRLHKGKRLDKTIQELEDHFSGFKESPLEQYDHVTPIKNLIQDELLELDVLRRFSPDIVGFDVRQNTNDSIEIELYIRNLTQRSAKRLFQSLTEALTPDHAWVDEHQTEGQFDAILDPKTGWSLEKGQNDWFIFHEPDDFAEWADDFVNGSDGDFDEDDDEDEDYSTWGD